MNQSKWYRFYLFNPERGVYYYAVAILDEGGFGKVWTGVTGGLPIAIKVIKPTSDFLKDFKSWFTEQNICLKCLNHPHIITTYDQFCTENGALVIVMEKAEGSLEDLLRKGINFDPVAICSIGAQMLSALHHIHEKGIIHRDISLKNILWFRNGVFKLSDFGISKEDISPEEFAITFIGHRSYIPPELLYAGYSNHQSDIYQLGLVLLTLLTGEHPIPLVANLEETRRMILEGVPRQIAESLTPQYGRLAEILSIMLRRRNKWRYQNAMEVWKDLYKEFERRKRTKDILEWIKQQGSQEPPSWMIK